MEKPIFQTRYKTWFIVLMSVMLLASGFYLVTLLDDMYSSGELSTLPLWLSIWVVVSFSLATFAAVIGIPYFITNRILFYPNRIVQKGLFTKTLGYDDITQLKHYTGGVKLVGSFIFSSIVIGQQYRQADEAIALAKKKAQNHNIPISN
ncbi:MAG: hypothetical protein U5J63_01650 [Fodinibius sp.]|nr:hypothetical protein [Fodinibius sp.]